MNNNFQLNIFRLPSIQSDANEENEENLNENRSLSPLSMNSEEDRQLLNQVEFWLFISFVHI